MLHLRSHPKYFLIFILPVIMLFSCRKDEYKRVPVIETKSVPITMATSAIVQGNIIDPGEGMTDYGHCWSLEQNPDITDSHTSLGTTTKWGMYTSDLKNLVKESRYYARAYLRFGNEVLYGQQVSFVTATGKALLNTDKVTNITINSATSGGEVISASGDTVIERGIIWDISDDFSIGTNLGRIKNGTGLGKYECEISGLALSTTYKVKAYAITYVDTAYGETESFKTLNGVPSVSTTAVNGITINSAISGGNITRNGGAEITERGVCWNTTGSPTIEDSKTINGSGNGSFTSMVTGLQLNTTYYLRAYATNIVMTRYGAQVTFTTTDGIASLSTVQSTNITINSAYSGGNITNDGGASITSRGVCWNTIGLPTTSDNRTVNGSGIGSFSSQLKDLLANNTYYVRSYAINSVGPSYGPEFSFKTHDGIPSITTTAVSNIDASSATSGGKDIQSGGAEVISRGVCWNTTGNPTLSDNFTNDGNGTSNYSSNISSLMANTLYYLRSYATTIYGTGYGNEISFLTKGLPEVNTLPVTGITENSSICNGEVINDWGFPVTSRGFCWSVSPNPTIIDNKTDDGSGTGVYFTSLSGITPNTTYFVRAYAENSIGISYGSELTFRTFFGSINDIEGNKYFIVQIGSQIWTAENLKTTKLNDGTSIPKVTDGNVWIGLSTPAYCWYDNNESLYKNPYGALYNWYTVNTGKLCPSGWHVPTSNELSILRDFLGGVDEAGGKLKETGTIHWSSPNTGATNQSNFSALPGGTISGIIGSFIYIRIYGQYWTSSESSSNLALGSLLYYNDEKFHVDFSREKKDGCSVRCLKDP